MLGLLNTQIYLWITILVTEFADVRICCPSESVGWKDVFAHLIKVECTTSLKVFSLWVSRAEKTINHVMHVHVFSQCLIPEVNNLIVLLKGKTLTLAHSFKDFIPQPCYLGSLGTVAFYILVTGYGRPVWQTFLHFMGLEASQQKGQLSWYLFQVTA